MTTAAIYARVSTDIQAEKGYSLETQIEACRKMAIDIGAETIKNYIDDGYSGAYLERPALDALRDALHEKVFDIVICYVPDRLARRLSHQLLLAEEIERSGATLHFVSVDFQDTPEGRLFFQMNGAFSEYEREKIRERTMRGRRAKLRSGMPINDSGVFGYDFIDGRYAINPMEAEIVQLIFSLYVEESIGGSKQIADELERRGIPSPKGKRKWHSATVHRLLQQRMYTGVYYSNRKTSTKTGAHSRAHFIRPEKEWIEMHCPNIIDLDIFERAQILLGMNKSVRKKVKAPALFQGFLVCGICGRKMATRESRSKVYYACSGNRGFATSNTNHCPARSAKTEIVDKVLWEIIKRICSSPKRLEEYIKKSSGRNAVDQTALKQKNLERCDKIKRDKLAIMDWYTNGYVTREDATKKLAALNAEEKELKNNLETIKTETISNTSIEEICIEVNKCNDEPEEKRKLLLQIIEVIRFWRTDKNPKGKYKLKSSIKFRI